jgi:hypothetical protein
MAFFQRKSEFPVLRRRVLVWREVAIHVALAEPQVEHEQEQAMPAQRHLVTVCGAIGCQLFGN